MKPDVTRRQIQYVSDVDVLHEMVSTFVERVWIPIHRKQDPEIYECRWCGARTTSAKSRIYSDPLNVHRLDCAYASAIRIYRRAMSDCVPLGQHRLETPGLDRREDDDYRFDDSGYRPHDDRATRAIERGDDER